MGCKRRGPIHRPAGGMSYTLAVGECADLDGTPNSSRFDEITIGKTLSSRIIMATDTLEACRVAVGALTLDEGSPSGAALEKDSGRVIADEDLILKYLSGVGRPAVGQSPVILACRWSCLKIDTGDADAARDFAHQLGNAGRSRVSATDQGRERAQRANS